MRERTTFCIFQCGFIGSIKGKLTQTSKGTHGVKNHPLSNVNGFEIRIISLCCQLKNKET